MSNMSEWRNMFHVVYKLVKTYCSISDESIANAVSVDINSVRQYSSQRQTMPDDIDSLCRLFENEIGKLNDLNKKILLTNIQKSIPNMLEGVKYNNIEQYVCAILKQFYSNEKSHIPCSANFSNRRESTGHIQAVIFDFDGTLTNSKLRTTWESSWEMLGYDVKECQELHKQYDKGDFTHQEWCNKTAEKFIEKKLTRQQVLELAKKNKIDYRLQKNLTKTKRKKYKAVYCFRLN